MDEKIRNYSETFISKTKTVQVKESVKQKKNEYIIMVIYIEFIMNLFTFLF